MKKIYIEANHIKQSNTESYIVFSMMGMMILSGALLTLPSASADDVVDTITITVPTSCSMSSTIATGNEHTAEISNGQYNSAIGETTIKAFCNDNEGFAIYAIGYTDNELGKNVLTNATLGATHDIVTGTATSGATSNWAMKLSTITSPTPTYPIIIAGSTDDTEKEQDDPDFSNFTNVPDEYQKVAYRTSSTDINPEGSNTAEGSTLKTTYQAYISPTQTAGEYIGQVKYTMIHPYNEVAPEKPIPMSSCNTSPMLSTITPGITYMQDINSSNKSSILSALTTGDTYQIRDNRDNETYCVGKLADGNLWLLDNLALDLTNSTVLNGMNETNTHASNTTLGYLKGTTIRDPSTDANGQYATAGVSNWTSATGNSYSAPLANLTNKDIVPTDATSQAGGYKVGGYYNYCAASAGSYCYGNGTSAGTSTGDATEDVCPKGWRMPTGSSSGEYSALAQAIYGSIWSTDDATAYASYRSALHLPLSGNFYDGTAGDQGSAGRFWSSTNYGNDGVYDLRLNTSYIHPAGSSYRNHGSLVRCVVE